MSKKSGELMKKRDDLSWRVNKLREFSRMDLEDPTDIAMFPGKNVLKNPNVPAGQQVVIDEALKRIDKALREAKKTQRKVQSELAAGAMASIHGGIGIGQHKTGLMIGQLNGYPRIDVTQINSGKKGKARPSVMLKIELVSEKAPYEVLVELGERLCRQGDTISIVGPVLTIPFELKKEICMPDPERKNSLMEYGRGVFVTSAMMPGWPHPTHHESAKEEPTLSDVIERLDRIEMLIQHIFDGHVLINGRFRKITL